MQPDLIGTNPMTLESSPNASPLLLSIGIGPEDGFIQPHLSTFSQER